MSSEDKKTTLRWGEGGSEHFYCILVVRSTKLGKVAFFSTPYGQDCSLTSLPKDDDLNYEVMPSRSPIRSLTSLDRA